MLGSFSLGILELYWGYIGIMENKMETTVVYSYHPEYDGIY